jgi:hypothetical protein
MARIPKSPEFVQDDWSLNDHLALDVGMRISSQSMGRSLPSRRALGWPIHRAQARRPSSAQGGTSVIHCRRLVLNPLLQRHLLSILRWLDLAAPNLTVTYCCLTS